MIMQVIVQVHMQVIVQVIEHQVMVQVQVPLLVQVQVQIRGAEVQRRRCAEVQRCTVQRCRSKRGGAEVVQRWCWVQPEQLCFGAKVLWYRGAVLKR